MKKLAIIPARGGSKRIPGKNIRGFLGKPIIAYSIEAARECGLFDVIMVSTEDKEIAKVAQDYGADIPFLRSKKNSDDYSTLADVVDEVMTAYEKEGNLFDFICCILPAAPLINKEMLLKGFDLLEHSSFDSVRPIVKYPVPIQWAFKLNDNKVEFINPENKNLRSQDILPAYHDAGQFYWMKPSGLLRSDNKGGFEVPEHTVQDIDNEIDWKLAELKYKLIYGNC